MARWTSHEPEKTRGRGAAIHSHGLSKRYGAVHALEDLSLEVPWGDFVGLLGPNGSGKTTSMNCLTTLVEPTAGRAQVAGHHLRASGVAIRREIGLVFQEPALDPSLTVDETLEFAGAIRSLPARVSRERAEELLALFELQDKRTARVATLSGGMKRALDIARSVLHQPPILFLDEPTVGLDLPNRRRIWSYVTQLRRRQGTTVLFTTHHLEEAREADSVYFLAEGRIVGSGAPCDLLARMGQQMLEIEGDDLEQAVALLSSRLGPCSREAERAVFRLGVEPRQVEAMFDVLGSGIRSVRRRSPTLDDVFVWMTRPELRKALD